MPRRPPLRPADELISPALERTIAAVDPPDSDAALLAVLRLLAGTLDRMSPAELRAMAGQTTPQLFRGLVELEARASRRRKPERRPVNRLEELRAANARASRNRVG